MAVADFTHCKIVDTHRETIQTLIVHQNSSEQSRRCPSLRRDAIVAQFSSVSAIKAIHGDAENESAQMNHTIVSSSLRVDVGTLGGKKKENANHPRNVFVLELALSVADASRKYEK